MDELKEIEKHKVWKIVSIQKCIDVTGKGPIGVRWLDVNKGDSNNPEYRSRLVAEEIKTDKRFDMFAATPPIEAKRMLFSLAVTEGIGYRKRPSEREVTVRPSPPAAASRSPGEAERLLS